MTNYILNCFKEKCFRQKFAKRSCTFWRTNKWYNGKISFRRNRFFKTT